MGSRAVQETWRNDFFKSLCVSYTLFVSYCLDTSLCSPPSVLLGVYETYQVELVIIFGDTYSRPHEGPYSVFNRALGLSCAKSLIAVRMAVRSCNKPPKNPAQFEAVLQLTHNLPCRYAWYRLFNLAKTYNKNLTQADNQQLACNVLLSALSILPYEPVDFARTENDLEIEKDRSMRMASILGFKVVSSS